MLRKNISVCLQLSMRKTDISAVSDNVFLDLGSMTCYESDTAEGELYSNCTKLRDTTNINGQRCSKRSRAAFCKNSVDSLFAEIRISPRAEGHLIKNTRCSVACFERGGPWTFDLWWMWLVLTLFHPYVTSHAPSN